MQVPAPIQHLLDDDDKIMAVLVAWLVGIPVLAIAGFIFMTIAGTTHEIDLQAYDLRRGLIGLGAGAGLGALIAIMVTTVYTKLVDREKHSHEH
jgi:hypothetical protein